ncbi:hypothetical protein BDV96DRAFT_639445 [Lophiotrema nucula]|uniref:Uncharacterized protein n=1 Tax=Lophiotrema nucula TaxID=690887 RepID=A0A6A5ZWY2_9PLEO|nr:hypothetical protein BDV96DRAFT_639445 [Lophiotrema nucula]
MSFCKTSFNCSACYRNATNSSIGATGCLTPLQANADIVGTGFLTGFLVIACITVWSLTQSYLSDSLPETYLTDLDRAVIASYQSFRPFATIKHALTALWQLYRWTRHMIPPKPQRRLAESLDKEKRMDIWIRFVVSLSDQQLCVGLAILVAATFNLCKLSVYELQVVNVLAWFASTTHLVTLDVIRQYLHEHGIVREIRVIAMIINLGLLMYNHTLIMLIPTWLDRKVPVGCIPKYRHILDIGDSIFTLAIVFSFLVYSYARRIIRLYTPPEKYGVQFGVSLASRSLGINRRFSPEESEECISRREMKRFLAIINHTPPTRSHDRRLLSQQRPTQFLFREYYQSAISNIPTTLYTLTYSLTQTMILRWRSGVVLAKEAKEMEFGQIMPLFLLALPLLTVVELYNETSKAKKAGLAFPSEDSLPNKVVLSFITRETTERTAVSDHDDDSLYRDPTPAPSINTPSKPHITIPLVGVAPEITDFYASKRMKGLLTILFSWHVSLLVFAGIITALRPDLRLRLAGNFALMLDAAFDAHAELRVYVATKSFYYHFQKSFMLRADADASIRAIPRRNSSTWSFTPSTQEATADIDEPESRSVVEAGHISPTTTQESESNRASLRSDQGSEAATQSRHSGEQARSLASSTPASDIEPPPPLDSIHNAIVRGVLAASPLANRSAPSTSDLERILESLGTPMNIRSKPQSLHTSSLSQSSEVSNKTTTVNESGHSRSPSESSSSSGLYYVSGGNGETPAGAPRIETTLDFGDAFDVQPPRRMDTEADIGLLFIK